MDTQHDGPPQHQRQRSSQLYADTKAATAQQQKQQQRASLALESPVVSPSGTRSLTPEHRVEEVLANGHDGDDEDSGDDYTRHHDTSDDEDDSSNGNGTPWHDTASPPHPPSPPSQQQQQQQQPQLEVHDTRSLVDSVASHDADAASLNIPPVVSPLSTAHSVSTDGMEDISLAMAGADPDADGGGGGGHVDRAVTPRPASPPPVPPAKDAVPPAGGQQQQQHHPQPSQETVHANGHAPDTAAPPLPSPPPPPPTRPAPPLRTPTIITPPKPPVRRGGPIGWLQRVASREFSKPSNPPPTAAATLGIADPAAAGEAVRPGMSRRNTDASATSAARTLDGPEGRRAHRHTLKDQFQALRMREEGVALVLPPAPAAAAATGDENAGGDSAGAADAATDEGQSLASKISRMRSESLASATLSVASAGSRDGRSDSGARGRRPSSPVPAAGREGGLPPLATLLNPNLPPGTVAGIAKSAADAAGPVNWELWQQVVNHGPAALRGANAEQFNAAIKAGIPQTIRGVIWQVLADSRNPELEEVYRELLARGTRADSRAPSLSFSSVAGNGNGDATSTHHASHPPSISEQPEPAEHANSDRPSPPAAADSARSSVHSGSSTPTNGSAVSHVSPTFSQYRGGHGAANNADTATLASTESAPRRLGKEEAAALQRLEKAIRRDLGSRTSYSKYFMSQRNQDGLFGVCKAYALYDEAVGYAQGMNFIVMPLLFNMEEAEAFTLMVRLMNKYGMREMFVQGMPGLHTRLYQFERLLEDLHPALACHLKRRGVAPILYATQWFLTLFAYRFPLQLVLRIYDLIFEEGVESTILRFSVAIMTRNAPTLLAMNDMASLTTFLKEKVFDVYIDKQPSATSLLESGFFGSSNGQDKEVYRADLMVQDACAIRLTPAMLRTYTREWEELTAAQHAAAAELDALKKTAAAQAARIRVLEEQSERADGEHVQLVSEIVKLKVENEELQDANEIMTVQVRELRNVVDRQQSEIEEKMRAEMDRAMQRNSEVHSQNRAMEEQLAEMERELVATKMKWAELSGEHDTLKQKWSDLRRALD